MSSEKEASLGLLQLGLRYFTNSNSVMWVEKSRTVRQMLKNAESAGFGQCSCTA